MPHLRPPFHLSTAARARLGHRVSSLRPQLSLPCPGDSRVLVGPRSSPVGVPWLGRRWEAGPRRARGGAFLATVEAPACLTSLEAGTWSAGPGGASGSAAVKLPQPPPHSPRKSPGRHSTGQGERGPGGAGDGT